MKHCTSSDEQMVRVLKKRADPEDLVCYKKAVTAFSETCYNVGKVSFIPIGCFGSVEDSGKLPTYPSLINATFCPKREVLMFTCGFRRGVSGYKESQFYRFQIPRFQIPRFSQ